MYTVTVSDGGRIAWRESGVLDLETAVQMAEVSKDIHDRVSIAEIVDRVHNEEIAVWLEGQQLNLTGN